MKRKAVLLIAVLFLLGRGLPLEMLCNSDAGMPVCCDCSHESDAGDCCCRQLPGQSSPHVRGSAQFDLFGQTSAISAIPVTLTGPALPDVSSDIRNCHRAAVPSFLLTGALLI
jgi:hypothetical protein